MSLGLTVANNFLSSPINKNSLSEINTSSFVYSIENSLDGKKKAVYHTNLIHLLDIMFTKNNLSSISIEQERFMKEFFKEAHTVTELLNIKDNYPYKGMDEIMLQLDRFLGSY